MESTPATLSASRLALFYVPVRCALVRGHICMGQGGRHALILSVTLHRSSWVLSVHGGASGGGLGGGDGGGEGGEDGEGSEGGEGGNCGGCEGDGGGGEGDGGGGLGDGGDERFCNASNVIREADAAPGGRIRTRVRLPQQISKPMTWR